MDAEPSQSWVPRSLSYTSYGQRKVFLLQQADIEVQLSVVIAVLQNWLRFEFVKSMQSNSCTTYWCAKIMIEVIHEYLMRWSKCCYEARNGRGRYSVEIINGTCQACQPEYGDEYNEYDRQLERENVNGIAVLLRWHTVVFFLILEQWCSEFCMQYDYFISCGRLFYFVLEK